jgi:hypothetical protein
MSKNIIYIYIYIYIYFFIPVGPTHFLTMAVDVLAVRNIVNTITNLHDHPERMVDHRKRSLGQFLSTHTRLGPDGAS